jgi:hypothetical protein
MKQIATVVLAIGLATLKASAQAFPYEFTVLNDPYFDLSAPVSVNNGELWDDPFYLTSTGFNVQLFEVVTNVLGVLSPGAQVVNLNEANPDTVQLLSPYYSDIMNASDTMAVSPISYQVEGPPGNGVFKMEWKNVGFYGEWAASNSYFNTTNFQLWIYQNSGVIEFRYGPNTIKSGSLLHIFSTGPLVFLGRNVAFDGSGWEGLWALGGDPQNPQVMAIPSGQQPDFTLALLGEPSSGTVYRFAPVVIGEQYARTQQYLTLWPTYASDRVSITTQAGESYSVLNAQGAVVLQFQAGNETTTLEVQALAAGFYVVQSTAGKTAKFIKS